MTYSASIRTRPRSDGTFAHDVRFRVDGQSRSQAFTDERAANAWAKVVRQRGPEAAVKMLNRDVTAGTPTLSEYAETYIAGKSGVEGLTLDHYRMFMRVSISPFMGDVPLTLITPELVAEWVNAQANPTVPGVHALAGKTIANRHGFLSAMLEHAVRRGLISRNPCDGTRLPTTESQEMVFLSPNEFTALLDFIPEPARPLVLLLAGTGLRWGEVTALQPGDFDLDAGLVRVSRAWKSSKARGWYIGPPKTKKSRRTVSMHAELVDVVAPLVEQAAEWVFAGRAGGPLRQQAFSKGVWTPARNLANGRAAVVPKGEKPDTWHSKLGGYLWDIPPASRGNRLGKYPRIHDLRHTHASWLINAGVPLPIIQRRLGHESITTTVDRYGHLAPDNLAVAAQATAVAMAGVLPQLEG